MARHEGPTFALGLLAVSAGMVVVLMALLLGVYIEATPRAIARSAKGHQIAVPAVVAVVAGVVTLVGRRHRWALAVGCVGAAAAAVAVALAIVLPSG